MRLRLALAAGAVALTAIALVSWPRAARGTTLVSTGSNVLHYCWASADSKDWARMTSTGMEFGLDVLRLAPKTGHVTVTKAELINPVGGIRLLSAVFAPNAQFGSGFYGPDYHLPPYLADKLQRLPATLTPTPKPAGATKFDGATWQLAIVASAPATARSASAAGVKLTYRSGSTVHTYRTVDGVRLVHSTCSRPTG